MPRSKPSDRYPDLFAPQEPPLPIAASERTKLLGKRKRCGATTVASD